MATKRTRQEKKAMPKKGQKTASRQAPKARVVEAGDTELKEPVPAAGPGEKEAIEEKEREEYRHGGIPIGSDPRE